MLKWVNSVRTWWSRDVYISVAIGWMVSSFQAVSNCASLLELRWALCVLRVRSTISCACADLFPKISFAVKGSQAPESLRSCRKSDLLPCCNHWNWAESTQRERTELHSFLYHWAVVSVKTQRSAKGRCCSEGSSWIASRRGCQNGHDWGQNVAWSGTWMNVVYVCVSHDPEKFFWPRRCHLGDIWTYLTLLTIAGPAGVLGA